MDIVQRGGLSNGFLQLLVLIGGPYYRNFDYRMIWLGAFLAIGLHFFPFAFVHGKTMLVLGLLVSINALIGMLISAIPLDDIAYLDAAIKVVVGLIMLISRNPLKGRIDNPLSM